MTTSILSVILTLAITTPALAAFAPDKGGTPGGKAGGSRLTTLTVETGMTRTAPPSSGRGGGRLFDADDYQPPDVGGPGQTKGAGTR